MTEVMTVQLLLVQVLQQLLLLLQLVVLLLKLLQLLQGHHGLWHISCGGCIGTLEQ